jgi:prolyl oligopeptidase
MLTLQFSQRVPTGKQAGNVEEDTVEITSKRINRLLRAFSLLISFACLMVVVHRAPSVAANQRSVTANLAAPSAAPLRPVTEEYFGTKVVDAYRYMENLKDPEVVKWFKDQDDYTRKVLARIPGRTPLLARIKELDQAAPFRIFDVQLLQGEKYFYQKRLAGEDVAKLYERDGLNGPEKLLIDPGTFVKQPGTHYSLDYYVPSLDGRYVAYGISPGGSEDAVIHILDVTTGRDSGEVIDRSWYGGISWMPDNHSFVHVRFQELKPGMAPAERRLKSRVLLHRAGTDPETDVAVFGYDVDPKIKLEPADASFVGIDPRTKYASACVSHGFNNDLTCYVAPVDSVGKPDAPWHEFCDTQDGITNLDIRGDDLYLISHKDAPRFKIIRTSVSHPDLARAEVVVPSGETVITNLRASTDAIYVFELDGGIGRLLRVPYSKGPQEKVILPIDGSIGLGGGDPRTPGFVLYLDAWTKAYKIYQYQPDKKSVIDLKLQPTGPFDEPGDLQAVDVRARSHDGVMIPLSIVHKRGAKLDGSHPTLLTGYGAYAINEDPYFDPKWIAWMERGGVLAFAHVRGGGEYGEEWHQGGMKSNKPNTWKDFIACAEYLVQHGYTRPERLAGEGGSAGGILIGRAFTERPDLFAAALDDVGLSDMIRDMFSPDGLLNVPEYGGLDTADGFRNLYEISAYYHVKDGVHYPAILLTTGMNDPRVVPWEPGKMAARLQVATASGKPVLLRVDYQGGHGGFGATRSQVQERNADEWSFLLWQFGMPEFQPEK